MNFYVGSCRCMYNLWDHYFAARLNTTQEILYFLRNARNIEKTIASCPADLVNKIFCDLQETNIVSQNKAFFAMKNADLQEVKCLIIEISSRKLFYWRNKVPINWYAAKRDSRKYKFKHNGKTYQETSGKKVIQRPDITYHVLSDEEIERDILEIQELAKSVFSPETTLVVMPHMNLKSSTIDDYIPSRNNLVQVLKQICQNHNIHFIDLGDRLESIYLLVYSEDYMEERYPKLFLEDVMHDGRHYNNKQMYLLARNILVHELNNILP